MILNSLLYIILLLTFPLTLCYELPGPCEYDRASQHDQCHHQDSKLAAFYKEVYAADSSPHAITFEEAISPEGVFYTNGMHLEYDLYRAISKRFNDAYKNIEISYGDIVEVPKANQTEEGTVGASVHWQGDYIHGGRDEFSSHAIMYIEKINGKQVVTQVFEISDYRDTHHLVF